jgi:putative transposase
VVDADAPNVLWAIDFQFDGKAIKIASMIDEHTRESLLHVVERSITAERPVVELEDAFSAAGGPPRMLRMDNGPELVSQALQRFCENKAGRGRLARNGDFLGLLIARKEACGFLRFGA